MDNAAINTDPWERNFGKRSIGGAYRRIGAALLDIEEQKSSLSDRARKTELQVSLSFISVEVLESYLEDLLDLSVSNDHLSIAKKEKTLSISLRWSIFALMGAIFAYQNAYFDAAIGRSLLFIALLGSFNLMYLFARKFVSSRRRLFFARLLSQEIGRRRGATGTEEPEVLKGKKGFSFSVRDKREASCFHQEGCY